MNTDLQALTSSESNEWYTPPRYIEMVKQVFDGGYIDLDPFSSEQANKIVGAENYFTVEDDAFKQDWTAFNVFMNPPYGKVGNDSQAGLACSHLIKEYWDEVVDEAIILVNSCTGAQWFQPLFDWTICFVNHRIRYVSPEDKKNQPTKDNVFVYLGPNWRRFAEVFGTIGRIRIRSAFLPQYVDEIRTSCRPVGR
jgi:hypothetical protein